MKNWALNAICVHNDTHEATRRDQDSRTERGSLGGSRNENYANKQKKKQPSTGFGQRPPDR